MRPVSALRLCTALLLVLAAATAGAQTLTVSPRQWDFGTMKQQQTATTTITLTNDGGGKLVIDNVHADCGCTVPTLEIKELRPGESTTLDIEFNSKRFSGNIFKTVRIESNDPVSPVVDVIITANVTTPLIVDPVSQRVGFARAPQGEVHTKRVTFTATEAEALEISADGTRRGLFEVSVTNGVDGNPRLAAIDVTVPADMPAGKQRDNVRVRTSIPEMPTVDIEMRCWVHQALMVSPEAVNWRFKPEFRSSVRVASTTDDVVFKITGAETDMPELTVEVQETVPNRETLIVLEGAPIDKDDVRAKAARGRIKGTLTIHTNLEQQPTIEIPITYMVRM
jgi:hypothetical protein